jgi:hypothetical protein
MTNETGQRNEAQALILGRLQTGDEIDLLDALTLFDVRRSRELWPLAQLRARGRINGPLEPYTEIPAAAWPYLRWVTDGIDFLIVTPEGTWVYDVMFSERQVTAEGREVPQPATAPAGRSVMSFEDPATVFCRIVDTPRPAANTWSMDEYNAELAKAGLSVTPDKERVSGITFSEAGQIVRGAGPLALHNALLVTRCGVSLRNGSLRDITTRRDIARTLYSWLATDHPNLAVVRGGRVPERRAIDDLVDTLRRYFGDLVAPSRGNGGAPVE